MAVPSRILAFRPATVVERLAPRSEACPLSPRELLGPAAALGIVLPVVRAPVATVARAALLAAKELRSAVGLALPAGAPAGAWFGAVAQAADEIAAGLPIFLSGEVVVAGEGATQVERAVQEAWRLVDDGLTHVAIDVAAVAPGERSRVVGDVVEAASDRGACADVVLSLADGSEGASRAAAMAEDLAGRGIAPDLWSVRCPAPGDDRQARQQASALARISRAMAGVALMRRGPVNPAILGLLRGSPVKACDDGGASAARSLSLVPAALVSREARADSRESPLERAVAALPREMVDRMEARAYVDALEFMERLGGRGSATALAAALERRLEEGG